MNAPDRNFNPRSPSGSNDEARRFIVTHEQLHPMRRQMPSRSPQQFPPSGEFWMYDSHREGDPSLAYSKGKAMYLSPGNPLVTGGLVDLITGDVTQALPGTWLALRDVPVAVAGSWNVPAPLVRGAVSGTPLKGDADQPTAFWLHLSDVDVCTGF